MYPKVHPGIEIHAHIVKKTAEFIANKIETKLIELDESKPARIKANRRLASKTYARRRGVIRVDGQVMTMKYTITHQIISAVKTRNLKHHEMASMAGIPRTKATRIMNQHIQNITLDFLVEVLSSLGVHAHIVISKVP